MDDDQPKPEKSYPLSASKMSKTPSWIMLGFILGAVFVAALPPLGKKTPESEPLKIVEPPRSTEPREPPLLTMIEDVFAVWGQYAVWSEDVTEVALWNSRDKAFTDCFEVRRYAGVYYFRTIPRLTRRVITHGKPMPESPLQFTETEEQYRDWVNYGRSERPVEPPRDLRPLMPDGARDSAVPPRIEATAPNVAPPRFERVGPPVETSPSPATGSPAKK